MNRIPKCRSKYLIPQPTNINPPQKESTKENIAQKLSKRALKFTSSRHFGKDITNNIKSSVNSIYNKHNNNKIVTIIEKKQNNTNNTIYIKKHSSSSQVAQKSHKNKSSIGEKKLREYKSGSVINNNVNNSNINNETKNETILARAKLHSSISFGVNANTNTNNNTRPVSSNNIYRKILFLKVKQNKYHEKNNVSHKKNQLLTVE